jgi:hypothetical protein
MTSSPSKSSKSVYIGPNKLWSLEAAIITIGRLDVVVTLGGIKGRGVDTSIAVACTDRENNMFRHVAAKIFANRLEDKLKTVFENKFMIMDFQKLLMGEMRVILE